MGSSKGTLLRTGKRAVRTPEGSAEVGEGNGRAIMEESRC